MYARWQPGGEQNRAAELDAGAEALWRDALADWNTPSRHDAFLKHCSPRGLLAAAGRRYRDRLNADPADAIARKHQDRILAMAAIALAPSPRPSAPVTRARWFWIVIVLGLVVGMVGAFVLRR